MAEIAPRAARKALTPDLAPETIGFRLGDEDRRLLAKHALQAGVSPHVLARAFVEQVLRSGGSLTQLLSILDELSTFREELSKLRTDISVSTAVLLVSAGKTTSEAARAWVEKNLNRE